MTEPSDRAVIDLLVSRDGVTTWVELKSGVKIVVHNVAWGYDIGDDYAHVTTNISPKVDGATVALFSTSDIRSISDPASGQPLA